MKGAEPAQTRDHIFFTPKVKETLLTTHEQKCSSEVKREGASPHSKWCQPTHRPLARIHLGNRCTCTSGRILRKTKYWFITRQSKMIGQRRPGRNAPRDSNNHEGMTVWTLPMCLFTCTAFPPNKHFTSFTPFCRFMEIHFYRNQWARVLSLRSCDPGGLVA